MGYEQREPVALCDGCGKALYEGDECFVVDVEDKSTGNHWDDLVIMISKVKWPQTLDCSEHYCCITPCLERAVVNELRKIHGVYHQAAVPYPNPPPAQDAQ